MNDEAKEALGVKELDAGDAAVAERRVSLAEAREGVPTGEMHEPSAAEVKARGRRNIAIALAVLGFVVLVYLTTFFRLAESLKTGVAG